MAAFRTLWTAFVGLYEESLPLVGGNLAALILNVPIGVALLLVSLPFAPVAGQPQGDGETSYSIQWLVAAIAWLMVFLPTPGNVALAYLTSIAAGPEMPRLAHFAQALRQHWRLALGCTAVSVVISGALVWNVAFYVTVATDWLRFASVLWLYAAVFWLGVQLYVAPLLVYVSEPRLVDLYRRAAFVCLGHLGYSLLLLALVLCVSFVSVVFLPLYVLVGGSLISLTQAHALREIRRRHGELVTNSDDEVARL